MPTSSTTSLKLDAAIKERVSLLASVRRRTPHWLMREAIEQYLEREEKREQFRQDTLAAWEHFEATGLHLTEEELEAWVDRLENDPNARLPECRESSGLSTPHWT